MFAKERMGFMPALCVAFLEELSDKEKLSFEELARQEERAEMVLKHPFLADKFARLVVAEGKEVLRRRQRRRLLLLKGGNSTVFRPFSGLFFGPINKEFFSTRCLCQSNI